MANHFNFKSPHCIEWAFSLQSTNDMRRVSKSFLLRDIKCNLWYKSKRSSEAHLICESNVTLTPAIEILVIATSNSNSSFANTNSTFKRTMFSGKRQEIWRLNSGCLLGNSLTLEVITHEILISKELQPKDITKSHELPESRTLTYLENMAHFQALSRDFEKLLEESSSFDVMIICDNSKIEAHKIVLETRSPVLSDMLKSDTAKGKSGFINVEDICSSIFKSFLRYLYTGMLPKLCKETAKELYKVGDKYAVEEIKKACSEFLYNILSDSNACDTLVFADLHSDENFRGKVIAYIVERKIPQYDIQWLDFCNRHSNLAIEVMNTFIKKHCPK